MSTLIEKNLWQASSPYLTEDQLAYFLGGTADSRYGRLHRAIEKGLLIRIRRGLYCLGERLAARSPHPFEIAQLIYGPSYISLESALSYHGLIPEAVHSIMSVTLKRANTFETPLGLFSYYRLPANYFFLGVNHVKENDYQFFMASAWKALFDYIYCYKKEWRNIQAIEESLRIELDSLPPIKKIELVELVAYYHSKRIDVFVKSIPKEFMSEY